MDEYENFGIKQLHAPTLDIAEPSFHDIVRCVYEMNKFVSTGTCTFVHHSGDRSSFMNKLPSSVEANKRIFVHCKSGRARAVCN